MDSEDIVLKVSGGRDNEGGKRGKNKKKKEKMISLDEFVAKHGDFGPAPPVANNSWAVMTENTEDETDSSFKFDRSVLPSAPKAAMGPNVDLSEIPAKGPFSAYIGNLSYDASEEDLYRLFSKLEVDNVRIITDGGRPRGYAYVDFETKESLIEALSYNEREWMNRNIRVDLATDKNQEGGGRPGMPGSGRSDEPDRTAGDWRRKDDPSPPPTGSFGSRDDRDSRSRFGGDRDRERGGERGGDRDRGYGFGRDRDGDRRGGAGGGGGGASDGGNWRDTERPERPSYGDRDNNRGFGGDRDRGGYGGRDRGFGGGDRDRYGGDRDRGSYGGDRDRRGYGGDRDRDFGGDRDGGRFGSRGGGYDRRDNGNDRGSRDGSRDGGNDRDNRGGYGGDRDNDRGGRYGGSRGGGYDDRGYSRRDDYGRGNRQDNGYERKPRSRDGSLDNKSEGAKERPVLKLQPRTKPVENKENQPDPQTGAQRAASIFGSAKPVNTYAKEKEMEEKWKKRDDPRDEPRRREEDSGRPRREEDSGRPRREEDSGRPRREEDSGRPRRSNEDGAERRRKSSSGSGGNALPVQKPPPPHAGRRASEDAPLSPTENPKSPTSPKPTESPEAKMVPAPPPKENAWAKKPPAAAPTASAAGRDASNNATSVDPRRDERREDRRDDRRTPAGRGGRPSGDHPRDAKDNRDRRPGGPRANTDGSAGDHQALKKHQREKKLPKSIDEMPKFQEDKSRDFSTVNKFSLLDDDEAGEYDDDNNEGRTGEKTASS